MPHHKTEILSQLISDDGKGEGRYRVRSGDRVHYLIIDAQVFDEDTMCRPHLLVPRLPCFPDSPWTKMHISRSNAGDKEPLAVNITNDALEEVDFTWNAHRIDVLTLPRIRRLRAGVFETLYEGRPAVAKIACFEWHIPNLTRETWAYHVLDHGCGSDAPIAPPFLGHLTENGRVMGFLMGKVEGRAACLDDVVRCEALVKRLHSLGLVHGDLNRFNFVVEEKAGGRVWLVDFEHAQDYDEEAGRAEIQSLLSELAETTGRGGVITTIRSAD